MRRIVCFLMLTVVTGCASLSVLAPDQYPFRAEFSAVAVIAGQDLQISGALFITSDTRGVAQIYGPGGFTAFTLNMEDGVLTILDTWGRQLQHYSIPLEGIVGLIAGTPPGGRYLFKRKSGDSLKVTYSWGTLFLGKDMLPREIHVRGNPVLDVFLDSDGNILTLLIIYGSDTLHLSINVKEGGRWF